MTPADTRALDLLRRIVDASKQEPRGRSGGIEVAAVPATMVDEAAELVATYPTSREPQPAGAPDVRVGQIWASCDKRDDGRLVQILELVHDTNGTRRPYATVKSPTGYGQKSRIRLDRFRPGTTGYRLIRDAPDSPPPDQP